MVDKDESVLPSFLSPFLGELVKRRYVDQEEAASGWRGLLIEADEDRSVSYLAASRDVQAFETVFLIDHLWCTTLWGARHQLKDYPVIRRNMQYVLGFGDEESESEADDDEGEEEEEATAITGTTIIPDLQALLHHFQWTEAEAAEQEELDLDKIGRFQSWWKDELPKAFPRLKTLSLQSICLQAEQAKDVLTLIQALPALKALWLNGNKPLMEDEIALETLLTGVPGLEIFNRKLTSSYGLWALHYLGDDVDEKEGPRRLDLKGRGLKELKPEVFAQLKRLEWLDVRRNAFGIDNGGGDEGEGEQEEEGPSSLLLSALKALPSLRSLRIDPLSPSDDAEEEGEGQWESEVAKALPELRWIDGRSITRVRSSNAGSSSGSSSSSNSKSEQNVSITLAEEGGRRAEIVDRVMEKMWQVVEPIRIAASEAHHSEVYWYVMDTPGLALSHAPSSKANVAMLAMREPRLGVTFTAAWPIRDIKAGERVTRDFLAGFPIIGEGSLSSIRRLLVEALLGNSKVSIAEAVEQGANGDSNGAIALSSPVKEQKQVTGEEERGEGDKGDNGSKVEPIFCSGSSLPLRVLTDMPLVEQSLQLPALFTFTTEVDEADIIWTAGLTHQRVKDKQWIGLLPNADVMDDKCRMAQALSKAFRQVDRAQEGVEEKDSFPTWLPLTFCLPEELEPFIHYWTKGQQEEEEGKKGRDDDDGLWTVKPPHLARGWDIVVTSSLPCILRHLQASGRLSVSRYIANPDLWQGFKYDLRLYVLLLSPTTVLIHEHFRVRVASKPYTVSASQLENLSMHLTNTTLGLPDAEGDDGEAPGGCPTETLPMQDLIAAFPGLHQGQEWASVRQRIDQMLKTCFELVATSPSSADDPYGRTLLGVDVLLDRSLQPYLIEMNVSPNCIGIVHERPNFFKEVFQAAFFDEKGAAEGRGGRGGGFRKLLW